MSLSPTRRETGSMFVETIFAITLIGIATLIAASLCNAHPRASARLEAQGDMLRAMENAVESLRAGTLGLQSGAVATAAPQHAKKLRIHVVVRPTEIADLFEVEVIGTCSTLGGTVTEKLHTKIWRPQ